MSKENILGTLVIVLLKAQHLIDNHTFYKQDPYAKLSLGGAEKRTPADPKGGQHPVWDHEVRIPISKDSSTKNRTLELSCWSEERTGDQLLGEGKLDIAKTLQTGEFDDWVPLSINGTQRGEIYLEMTFFAAGPAPLTRRPSKFHPNERLARPAQPKKAGGLPAFNGPTNTTSHPPHKQTPPLPAQPQQPPPQSQRPPQPQRPPQHQTSAGGQHLVPPGQSYSPGHSPPKTADSALPTLPLADTGLKPVPTILRPGPRGGKRPVSEIYPAPSDASLHGQYPDPRDQATSQHRHTNSRPQSLMAGSALPPTTYQSPLDNPNSRARPTSTYEPPYGAPPSGPSGQITPPHAGYSSPPRSQHTPLPYSQPGSGNGTPQPAYTAPYTSSYPSYPGPQTNEPASYTGGPGPNGFSFPVPHMTDYGQSGPPAPPPPPSGGYAPYPGARNSAPPPPQTDSDLPDPYLQKRYQTPLPLPGSPPPNSQYSPYHSHSNSYSSTPVPPAGFAVAEPYHQQPSPPQYGQRMPDPGVSAGQRAAEEAERQRKEQEELDAKLARELDMQLNMSEEHEAPRVAVGMPGGW